MKILIAIPLLLGLIAGPQNDSDTYLLSSSSMTIEGTSSLHDWTMTTERVDGKASLLISEEGELTIQNLNISLKAESLKSNHSGMDKNAYKALKTSDYPQITFVLKKVNSIQKNGTTYRVNGTGDLTVAGKTKSMTLAATCSQDANGAVWFKGETKFKMTDFGVEPPTAVFGTIKTGDEITIKYRTGFTKSDS
jgi:polyisoprenoid-binding protein YceI